MEFKSYFASHIENYIKLKQSTGYKFITDIKNLKRFDEFLFVNNIEMINEEVIDLWVSINHNWSINNKARNITTIKNLCIYLKNNNIIDYIFNKRGYKSKRIYQPYIFSHEEIKNIVYYADNYYSKEYFEMKYIMSFLIRLLYGTGMRLGEALSIEKENINYEQGIITLKETKNDKERLIVLTDNLTKRLNEYSRKMNRDTKYLFYNNKGNKITYSVIERHFYKILTKCNIKRTDQGPRIHDLRFTFINHTFNKYVASGKDTMAILPIIMTYVGHSCFVSTEYYLKQTVESINFIKQITEEYLGGTNNES